MTNKMIIRDVNVEELKFAPYNPRMKISPGDSVYEKIKNSLLKFGSVQPLVVNADMTVVGGNQRLLVMKDLGWKTAPCVMVNLAKNDEKALNIALNKISNDWDNQGLNALIAELREYDPDFDLSITGFDEHEIDLALASFEGVSDPLPPKTKVTSIADDYQAEDAELQLLQDYEEPTNNMRRCPHCGHIDIERAFAKVGTE